MRRKYLTALQRSFGHVAVGPGRCCVGRITAPADWYGQAQAVARVVTLDPRTAGAAGRPEPCDPGPHRRGFARSSPQDRLCGDR